MIVSIAIAVLPVWRSPMISSRWPRPIGIIASIAFRPVCIGSLTGWRWTTPGALNSAGRVSSVAMSPLPSSGRPSGSTIRPRRASPTGTWSSRPVRLTWSPSSILSHSPNSTAPTLSDSRFSARPVTSCGSSSSSSDMQLSRPWSRAMPSATESTVPTSDRSAPPSSSPSMRCFRMLVISSGLICTVEVSPYAGLCGLRDLFAKSFQSVAQARVQDHVPDADHEAAQKIRIHARAQLHAPPRLLLDALADVAHERVVQVDGASDAHGQQLVLLRPERVEAAAHAEDHRHAMALRQQLEEVHGPLVGVGHDAPDAVLLLLGREVRREQEHLEVPVLVQRVRELAQLIVHAVERIGLVGRLEQSARVDLGDLLHQLRPLPSLASAEKSTSPSASSTSLR